MDDEKKISLTEAEIRQIREGLARTYKERFLFATSLYKAQLTMNRAVITHKQFIKK